MVKSLTKDELFAGISAGLEKAQANRHKPLGETIVLLMDKLAPEGANAYHNAYIGGGCDAIELIRAVIDDLYADPVTV